MNINPNQSKCIDPAQQDRPRQWRDPMSHLIIQAIRVVNAVPTTVWRPVVSLVLAAGAVASLAMYSGLHSANNGLSRGIREVDGTNDSLNNETLFPSTNSTENNSQANTTANIDALGTQANLDAILDAAGYLAEGNNTDGTNRTIMATLLFSDQACEDNVLAALFDESTSGNTNSTDALERANNATVWQSRISVQRQINLDESQFEAALGAVLISGEDGCQVRLSIDPTLNPEVQAAEAQQQMTSQNVDASLENNNEGNATITCLTVPGSGIKGKDMFGNTGFEADLNVCQRQSTSKQRTRRDLASATSQPKHNMTEAEVTSLQELIQQVRQENCPNNITVIDGAAGNANTTGSLAFRFTTAAIQRLCPNTTIIPLSQANTTIATEILGLFGLVQLLEDMVLPSLTEGIILIGSQFDSLLDAFNLLPLQPIVQALTDLGVPIISTEAGAWTDFIPNVISDGTVAEALPRAKRTRRAVNEEASSPLAAYVAISVGAALLLIPSIWMLTRKCKEKVDPDGATAVNEEEMLPLNTPTGEDGVHDLHSGGAEESHSDEQHGVHHPENDGAVGGQEYHPDDVKYIDESRSESQNDARAEERMPLFDGSLQFMRGSRLSLPGSTQASSSRLNLPQAQSSHQINTLDLAPALNVDPESANSINSATQYSDESTHKRKSKLQWPPLKEQASAWEKKHRSITDLHIEQSQAIARYKQETENETKMKELGARMKEKPEPKNE